MSSTSSSLARLIKAPNVVFDTMVPVHWAAGGHEALLRRAFRGRAVVPGRVHREIDGLSRNLGPGDDAKFPAAAGLLRQPRFARVIEIADESDRIAVRELMESWTPISRVEEDPNENRGEAEAIQAAIKMGGVPMVCQDNNGYRSGRALGLEVYTSIDLLRALVVDLHVSAMAIAWDIYTSVGGTGLRPVPGFPYDEAGRNEFMKTAAALEAIAARVRARRGG